VDRERYVSAELLWVLDRRNGGQEREQQRPIALGLVRVSFRQDMMKERSVLLFYPPGTEIRPDALSPAVKLKIEGCVMCGRVVGSTTSFRH